LTSKAFQAWTIWKASFTVHPPPFSIGGPRVFTTLWIHSISENLKYRWQLVFESRECVLGYVDREQPTRGLGEVTCTDKRMHNVR
jgi:hypothetical protein